MSSIHQVVFDYIEQLLPVLKFERQPVGKESFKEVVQVDERKYELNVISDVDNASLAVGYQLKLRSVGKDDFGLYSLTFENQKGVQTYQFEMKLRANYGEYFVQLISYIVVGVLIFTLIILISILVCHLVRIKNEQSKLVKNQQNDSELTSQTTSIVNNFSSISCFYRQWIR